MTHGGGNLGRDLRKVGRGLVLFKNLFAERCLDEFMKRAKIDEHTQVQAPNGKRLPVRDALLFLLQSAWDKGYFMAKFYRQRRIPPPKEVASAQAVLDWIIEEHEGLENIGASIDVFLQRAVSLCTEEEPIERSLRLFPFGDALFKIVQPSLVAWSDSVRSLFGSGIVASEAEDALAKR